MSDLWELVDICHHQEHHPRGGGLPQPKERLKSGSKPPPPPPLRPRPCPLEPMGRVRFPKLPSNLWCDLLILRGPK